MNELTTILEREVAKEPLNNFSLLCSGGIDSLSVGIAAMRQGKQVTAYSFRLDVSDSYDNQKAKEASEAFGWDHVECVVDTTRIVQDIDFLMDFGCVRKVQFESLYPFLYVYPKITTARVWSGQCADLWYGTFKSVIMHHRYPREKFDAYRRKGIASEEKSEPVYSPRSVRITQDLSSHFGVTHFAPYYESRDIHEFMLSQSWDDLNKPKQKRHVREAYAEHLKLIHPVKPHISLQLKGNKNHIGVSDVFADLLKDPAVNITGKPSVLGMLNDRRRLRLGEEPTLL